MVRSIFVWTFRSLALDTLREVTVVTHVFGPVLHVVVAANAEQLDVVQDVVIKALRPAEKVISEFLIFVEILSHVLCLSKAN